MELKVNTSKAEGFRGHLISPIMIWPGRASWITVQVEPVGNRSIGCCPAGASILLAASVFHFGTIGIGDLKNYLRERGVTVR